MFKSKFHSDSTETFSSIKKKHETQKLVLIPFDEFEKKFNITKTRDDLTSICHPNNKHYNERDFSKINLQNLRKESGKLMTALQKEAPKANLKRK